MQAAPPLTITSPLSVRHSLRLLLSALFIVIGGFGLITLSLWLIVPLREHAFSLLAWAMTGLSVALLFLINNELRFASATWSDLGFRRPTRRMWHLMWQLPLVLAALIAVQLVFFSLFGSNRQPPSSSVIDDILTHVPIIAAMSLFITISVLTPIWEEAFYRGIVYGSLRSRYRFAVAVLSSAAIFAFAHVVPLLAPYYITFGIILAVLYEFHKTLWAPVIAHALINTLVSVPVLIAIL